MSTSPSSKCLACTVDPILISYSQRKCRCSDLSDSNQQQVPKFPKLDLPEHIDNESKRYDKKEDNKVTKSKNDNIIIKDIKNNKSTSVKMLSKSKSTLHLFYLFLISIGIGININLILKYITIKYLLSFIL